MRAILIIILELAVVFVLNQLNRWLYDPEGPLPEETPGDDAEV
jgi:hypothetical protein